MSTPSPIAVDRRPGRDLAPAAAEGLAGLLADYHLQTQAEKGEAVAGVTELPDRYRSEITDPRSAFRDDLVLLASCGGTPAGCLVVTSPVGGGAEVKRLWTAPKFRGVGVASRLIGAALAYTDEHGVRTVRLSVWKWRTGAVALYERLGFTVTDPWEARDRLVCMERRTA
ncbi:GNAT family N-acetyltransferase [Streptomyces sp. NPDC058231]|uniref:GNAT family N-acetyltransferase n=1 Tax=Streptomyces sp. NPDC058231 TaxID=3346392 RepID=UPI0036E8B8AC